MTHRSKLRPAGGRPRPHPLVRPLQSMALKWSPESHEQASSDLLRSSSLPPAHRHGDCPSVTIARHTVFMRTRSAMDVDAGSL